MRKHSKNSETTADNTITFQLLAPPKWVLEKKWTLFHPILCVKTHEALQLTLLLFFKSTQAKRLLCSSNKCMTIDL